MSGLLFIIGIITVIAGILLGFMTGSILGFILSVLGSLFIAVIFFALAKALDLLEDIQAKLYKTAEKERKIEKLTDSVACARCKQLHDSDCTSCPHCAYRPS